MLFLSVGSRMKLINDFGFVILEIAPVEPHDSGVYTCVARNPQGEVRIETSLNVERKAGVQHEWQLPEKVEIPLYTSSFPSSFLYV